MGKPYLFPRNRTVRHRRFNRKEIEEDHGRLNSVMVGGYPHQNKRIGGGHVRRVSLAAFDPVFVSPSSSFKPGILAEIKVFTSWVSLRQLHLGPSQL